MRASTARVWSLTALLVVGSVGGAEGGWDEGIWLFRAGSYDQAATEFERTLQIHPDWWGGHYMLGWTQLRLGLLEQAEQHLTWVDWLRPGDLYVGLRMAELHVARGRYATATALLSEIDLAPLSQEVQALVAELRARAFTKGARDNWELAKLARAVSAAPDDARAQYAWGLAAYNAGDTLTAVAALGRATELDPTNLEVLDAYTRALLRRVRETRGEARIAISQKAVSAASRLVAANPTHESLTFLGAALLGTRAYERGLEILTAAADLDRTQWLPLYYIGQAYIKLDRPGEAEEAFRLALAKASPEAEERISKMLRFLAWRQSHD